jgi:GH15 family glucan-1,4-alpha-glucosidase
MQDDLLAQKFREAPGHEPPRQVDELLWRYRGPDGLQGTEGVFVVCTFWLAEYLARRARTAEAEVAFAKASAAANDLGLFAEEFDPATGMLLGNFPQALTHLSHITAAVALAEGRRGGGSHDP